MPAGRPTKYKPEYCGIIDVDYKQQIEQSELLGNIGEISDSHESEKEFQAWLIANKHVLLEVIGLKPDDRVMPAVNSCLMKTNLRPDILIRVIQPEDCLYIVEVKNTRAYRPSHAMTSQVAAIGQLLLYKAVCGQRKTKLFLIDSCIHKETAVIVDSNNLPISLIQAKRDRWVVNYRE